MIKQFTFFVLVLMACNSYASDGRIIKETPSTQSDNEKAKKLISFVEFLLNTVGSEASSTKEKNTIITQTYLKAFESNHVRIEDDLHQRDVVINKEIQNYLRDVDIFFKNVKFDFEIKDITKVTNDRGQNFLKIRTARRLSGTSFDNKPVENQLERFLEINLDDENNEFKIASIYNADSHNRLTLQQWWKDLSFEWKVIFQRKLQSQITDKETVKLLSIDELDLSYNRYIQTLDPLNVLVNLKKVNISNTTVADLTPLHGLSNLQELYISNTTVKKLDMVEKLPSLKILSFESTDVSDITPLLKLTNIEKIICTNTRLSPEDVGRLRKNLPNCEVISESVTLNKWWSSLQGPWRDVFRKHITMVKLEPNAEELNHISEIKKLDISGMEEITDLSPLIVVKDLQEINASKTGINDISVLRKMKNLKNVNLSNTYINDIGPLMDKSSIESLNVNYTQVADEDCINFLADHPNTKVIFNSVKYVGIWIKLSKEWKEKLTSLIGLSGNTSVPIDQFYDIVRLTELDISNNQELKDLSALQLLPALKKFNMAKLMQVTDLTPLGNLRQLEELDCSYNPIHSIELLGRLPKLKKLSLEYTKVDELAPIENSNTLTSIKLSGTRIKNLGSLRTMKNLTSVEINNTSISNISPLLTLQYLKNLSCFNTRLEQKDVKEFKESKPDCTVGYY